MAGAQGEPSRGVYALLALAGAASLFVLYKVEGQRLPPRAPPPPPVPLQVPSPPKPAPVHVSAPPRPKPAPRPKPVKPARLPKAAPKPSPAPSPAPAPAVAPPPKPALPPPPAATSAPKPAPKPAPHIYTAAELLKLLVDKAALEDAPAVDPNQGLLEPSLSLDPTYRDAERYLSAYALYAAYDTVVKDFGALCRTDGCVDTVTGIEKAGVAEGQRVLDSDFDDKAASPQRYQTIMSARGALEKSVGADLDRYLAACRRAEICR